MRRALILATLLASLALPSGANAAWTRGYVNPPPSKLQPVCHVVIRGVVFEVSCFHRGLR